MVHDSHQGVALLVNDCPNVCWKISQGNFLSDFNGTCLSIERYFFVHSLASYQPLSLSRCGRRSTRNNSAFVVTSWTSGKPNLCPTTDYATLVQLRLTNAIYTQWTSNSAWRMLLKDVIVNGVEKYCQCGFSLPYFTSKSLPINASFVLFTVPVYVHVGYGVILHISLNLHILFSVQF